MNDEYIRIFAIMPSEIYKTKDLTSEEKLIAEKGALNSLLPIPPKELGDSKFIKEIYYGEVTLNKIYKE